VIHVEVKSLLRKGKVEEKQDSDSALKTTNALKTHKRTGAFGFGDDKLFDLSQFLCHDDYALLNSSNVPGSFARMFFNCFLGGVISPLPPAWYAYTLTRPRRWCVAQHKICHKQWSLETQKIVAKFAFSFVIRVDYESDTFFQYLFDFGDDYRRQVEGRNLILAGTFEVKATTVIHSLSVAVDRTFNLPIERRTLYYWAIAVTSSYQQCFSHLTTSRWVITRQNILMFTLCLRVNAAHGRLNMYDEKSKLTACSCIPRKQCDALQK